jgi:hypothetical protein
MEGDFRSVRERFGDFVDAGRKQAVRNRGSRERTIRTGIAPLEIKRPRVRDRCPDDLHEVFTSALLPAYQQKTRSLEGLIPWLHLKDVRPAASPRPSMRSLGRR